MGVFYSLNYYLFINFCSCSLLNEMFSNASAQLMWVDITKTTNFFIFFKHFNFLQFYYSFHSDNEKPYFDFFCYTQLVQILFPQERIKSVYYCSQSADKLYCYPLNYILIKSLAEILLSYIDAYLAENFYRQIFLGYYFSNLERA